MGFIYLNFVTPLLPRVFVDALGLIGQLLDHLMPGNKPTPKPEKQKDGGYRRYDFEGADNDWVAY